MFHRKVLWNALVYKEGSHMLLSVGQPFPFTPDGCNEGVQFQIDANGPMLIVYFRNPTVTEVHALRNNKISLGICRAGDHTTFLLVKCPELLSQWADAPYAYGLVSKSLSNIPHRPKHMGWQFKMFLVDPFSKIVHAMRTLTGNPLFSEQIDADVYRQKNNLAAFSVENHDAEIRHMYLRYPNTYDMVKDSLIT